VSELEGAPPQFEKGAFVDIGLGTSDQSLNTVIFQFNPETISRTPSLAQPPQPHVGAGRRNTLQQPSEPTESINFTLRIDASDQLEANDKLTVDNGILPALSALEYLMIPENFTEQGVQTPSGTAAPYRTPPITMKTVLFYWGSSRILPVNITSMSITETDFDVDLNPVRAEVTINLQVLTPSEVIKQDKAAQDYYRQTVKTRIDLAKQYRQNASKIGISAKGIPPPPTKAKSGGGA
jgi:hypothetical protein